MTQHQVLYLGLDPSNYQTTGQLTHLPLIEIVPRPFKNQEIQSAFGAFKAYTHFIITSKSTVQILKDYLPLLNISLKEWSAKTTIAVGTVTAKHLTDYGIFPSIIAEEETSEGIVESLKSIDLANAFFFWPHAARARPLIANYLYAQNAVYAECILYDTIARRFSEAPSIANYQELIFTSPSTVDAFLQLYGSFPTDKILTPIGPVTNDYLSYQKSKFS